MLKKSFVYLVLSSFVLMGTSFDAEAKRMGGSKSKAAGAVIGGLVGGLIGNRVAGRGDRTVGTIAGGWLSGLLVQRGSADANMRIVLVATVKLRTSGLVQVVALLIVPVVSAM